MQTFPSFFQEDKPKLSSLPAAAATIAPQPFVINPSNHTEGPRVRNQATVELQNLIENLTMVEPHEVQLTLDASGDWLLVVNSVPFSSEPINLSLLMRHANLSHIVLTDEMVTALALFSPLLNDPRFIVNNLTSDNVFAYLPASIVSAIRFYTSTEFARFNAFWRGEPQVDLKAHVQKIAGDGLQFFIIGVLINCGLGRIPHLLSIHPECSAMMLPAEFTLQRHEKLNQNEQVRLRKGVTSTGVILSMSYAERATLEITNPSSYAVSEESISLFGETNESEIMLADSTQIEWGAIVNGKRTGKIINTPDTDNVDRLPVAKALSIAYRNHYAKPYNDMQDDDNDSIIIEAVNIARPAHGLAHITECLILLSPTIALFAKHAVEPAMRDYCQNMSAEEREFLNLLVTYKNTGRESEVSFTDPKYDRYKNASAENFVNYARKHTQYTEQQIAEGRELIRERGNPHYVSGNPIMQFRVRILNLNHDLDLRRLFSEATSNSAIDQHLSFFIASAEMSADYQLVKDFAVACMVAMGEMGTARGRNYHAPFHIFSSRVAVADELLNHVPSGIPSVEDTQLYVQVIQSFASGQSNNASLDLISKTDMLFDKEYFKDLTLKLSPNLSKPLSKDLLYENSDFLKHKLITKLDLSSKLDSKSLFFKPDLKALSLLSNKHQESFESFKKMIETHLQESSLATTSGQLAKKAKIF